MDISKFENGIKKTGFGLEYTIATQLKQAGWTVISNKYYIDDHQNEVREIDLVAYKYAKVDPFPVVTTLIISCKKSEQNVWALLAKEIDLTNPNAEWRPFHGWTNDKALSYQLLQGAFSRKYYEDVERFEVGEALRLPEVEIFAFQELNRESGSPQNDKPIFNSVTSLMKAQAYELNALPQRKKKPIFYQFNLLSVVDSELIQLNYKESGVKASQIDTAQYVARYIVNKKETFSRILFVRSSAFQKILGDFDRLHKANCAVFPELRTKFYVDIFTDWSRTNMLLEEFRNATTWSLKWRAQEVLSPSDFPDFQQISFSEQQPGNPLIIRVPANQAALTFLNSDSRVITHVAAQLDSIYHYKGRFEFQDIDVPF